MRCDELLFREDHNATSYSTETQGIFSPTERKSAAKIITLRAIALKLPCGVPGIVSLTTAKIITLRAIALKLSKSTGSATRELAKIITLRAIALKLKVSILAAFLVPAKIITLRAIALKPERWARAQRVGNAEDHNATSYSTETGRRKVQAWKFLLAKIITLRAIALKLLVSQVSANIHKAKIITLRAIALKPHRRSTSIQSLSAKIITLRAIALKLKGTIGVAKRANKRRS